MLYQNILLLPVLALSAYAWDVPKNTTSSASTSPPSSSPTSPTTPETPSSTTTITYTIPTLTVCPTTHTCSGQTVTTTGTLCAPTTTICPCVLPGGPGTTVPPGETNVPVVPTPAESSPAAPVSPSKNASVTLSKNPPVPTTSTAPSATRSAPELSNEGRGLKAEFALVVGLAVWVAALL